MKVLHLVNLVSAALVAGPRPPASRPGSLTAGEPR